MTLEGGIITKMEYNVKLCLNLSLNHLSMEIYGDYDIIYLLLLFLTHLVVMIQKIPSKNYET